MNVRHRAAAGIALVVALPFPGVAAGPSQGDRANRPDEKRATASLIHTLNALTRLSSE
jgi:hypothetical protein